MRIGAWSMLLLVLEVQLLVLAAMLAAQRSRASAMLALVLVVIAGLLTPFAIGYAGAYDAWPWLSFAPFAVPLALGPALYAYAVALTRGHRIGRMHWAAPVVQFALQAAIFPWPVADKTRFDAAIYEPFLAPLIAAAVLASMAGYGWASARALARYRDWLRARRRSLAPVRRVALPVVALCGLLAARAGYELWDRLAAPVSYFDLFAYYVALGVAGLAIGLDGWRGGRVTVIAGDDPDWAALGRDWIARMEESGWWREETLDVPALARRLATNTTRVSRALNAAEGSFSEVVGRIRAEAVAGRLDQGAADDLLDLAIDAGFGSKASFNRAFRARFGTTPSAYRARLRSSAIADAR
jgi:AraC-like DNA-binding protein